MNLSEFTRVVREFARDVPTREVLVMHRKLAFEGLKQLVYRTPVKTGRARGNWQVGIGLEPAGKLERNDKNGNATIAEGNGRIATIAPYSVTFLTNNVDYICRLEDGSSRQAPQGMLALTFDDLVSPFRQ